MKVYVCRECGLVFEGMYDQWYQIKTNGRERYGLAHPIRHYNKRGLLLLTTLCGPVEKIEAEQIKIRSIDNVLLLY